MTKGAGKINVCHVSTLTRWGGVETRLIEYLSQTRDRRLRHFVIATSARKALVSEIESLGVPVFIPRRRVRFDPTAIAQMAAWMRRHLVDVVHSRNAPSNLWGGLAASMARVSRRIGGEHGTVSTLRPPLAWLESLVYSTGDLVIANSHASRAMVTQKYGIRKAKVKVIHNAVSPSSPLTMDEARKRLDIPRGYRIIGSVGRLDTPKDFFTFLRAASIATRRRKDLLFALVGSGPLDAELKAYAGKLHLSDRKFVFVGRRNDAAQLISAFDIFVSTSLFESFGNTLVEAGLAERSCLAPRVGGIPEVVVHGETGLLLDPKEPIHVPTTNRASPVPKEVFRDDRLCPPRSLEASELADEIIDLLDCEAKAISLGAAAKARTEMLFSIDRYVEQLEGTYVWLSHETI